MYVFLGNLDLIIFKAQSHLASKIRQDLCPRWHGCNKFQQKYLLQEECTLIHLLFLGLKMTTPILVHTQRVQLPCQKPSSTPHSKLLFFGFEKYPGGYTRSYRRDREMAEPGRGPTWEAKKWEIPTHHQSIPIQSAHNVLLYWACSEAGGFGTDMVWNSHQIFKTELREQRRPL